MMNIRHGEREKMLRESSGVKVWVEVRRAAKARLPPAGEAELLASQPCSDTMLKNDILLIDLLQLIDRYKIDVLIYCITNQSGII